MDTVQCMQITHYTELIMQIQQVSTTHVYADYDWSGAHVGTVVHADASRA